MKNNAAILACACLFLASTQAVKAIDETALRCYPITLKDAYPETPPDYRDYPAAHPLPGLPAAPVFDSPEAVAHKTEIAAAAARGPDFDGHFTVVKLDCGITCMQIAIVDGATGKVFFPANLQHYHFAHVDDVPVYYSLHSNLLVLLGTVQKDRGDEGIHYFMWVDDAMTHVESIPVHKQSCN